MVKNSNVRHHGANSRATAGISNSVFQWGGWILRMLAVEVGRLPDTLWCTVKEEAALWLCHFVFMNLMPAIEGLWEVPWFDREKSATA